MTDPYVLVLAGAAVLAIVLLAWLVVRIGSLDAGTPVQLPASGPAGALD